MDWTVRHSTPGADKEVSFSRTPSLPLRLSQAHMQWVPSLGPVDTTLLPLMPLCLAQGNLHMHLFNTALKNSKPSAWCYVW
jgi:hypothetical protein